MRNVLSANCVITNVKADCVINELQDYALYYALYYVRYYALYYVLYYALYYAHNARSGKMFVNNFVEKEIHKS